MLHNWKDTNWFSLWSYIWNMIAPLCGWWQHLFSRRQWHAHVSFRNCIWISAWSLTLPLKTSGTRLHGSTSSKRVARKGTPWVCHPTMPSIHWWPTTARPTIKVSSFMRASPHDLQYKKMAWVSLTCSKVTQKANHHNKRSIMLFSCNKVHSTPMQKHILQESKTLTVTTCKDCALCSMIRDKAKILQKREAVVPWECVS
jgi:hypothetical protein